MKRLTLIIAVGAAVCPAVLTESLFQDNKADVEFMLSEYGKTQIVNLHVNGIIMYLTNNASK